MSYWEELFQFDDYGRKMWLYGDVWKYYYLLQKRAKRSNIGSNNIIFGFF